MKPDLTACIFARKRNQRLLCFIRGTQISGFSSPRQLSSFTVATAIFGFPVCNLFRVTLLVSRIFEWHLGF